MLSKAENWFKPKNHYTVEKGDTSHYAVLGGDRDATDLEIKRAYRQQSKTCHPDVDPSEDGRKRFDAVTLAYETLKDSKKETPTTAPCRSSASRPTPRPGSIPWPCPFCGDSAMPTLSDFTKNVEKATENITMAQAAAAAAGFVVAGPVGAAAGVAAQKVYSDNIDEAPAVVKPAPTANATNATKTPPRRRGPASTAAAGAVGFVVAGPIGAAAGVAAERYRAGRRRRRRRLYMMRPAPRKARGRRRRRRRLPCPPRAASSRGGGGSARLHQIRTTTLIRMTRSELRRTLLRRGVQATGSKAELIERIRARCRPSKSSSSVLHAAS